MKKILSEIASGVQKTLDMFTNVLRKVKERVSKSVPSFKTPKASPYTGDKLTEIEKISYQCKITYRGDIRHLFLFYPFDEILDAELYMFITGITTHLTAITAYHEGRTDLMRSPTAFRRISLDWADNAVNKFLEQKRRMYVRK